MATLDEVADSVLDLRTRLFAVFTANGWPEEKALSAIQGYLPAYPASALLDYITYTAERIRQLSAYDMDKSKIRSFLGGLPAVLSPIQFANLPNDPVTVINGLMMTLQWINARLPTESKGPVPLDWESVKDKAIFPKDLLRRLRAVEANLARLEPRSKEIERKVDDIDAAHAAAEQLPEDLAELSAKRDEVQSIVEDAQRLLDHSQKVVIGLDNSADNADAASARLVETEARANKVIEKSEQALRGSTGVGLANAFEKRKENLSKAGSAWVAGLLLALISAILIGADRVATMQSLLRNDVPAHIVWVNAILSVLGVGGPIWFAWLSTKQIGVTFRLAEDYAFKAAVSKAYEGYRKEAVDIDPALQARLFASALDRLEEAPIRLMDKETHSSPLQELLSNPAIRKNLENIPGIAEKIIGLIPSKGAAAVIAPVAAVATLAAPSGGKRKQVEEAE